MKNYTRRSVTAAVVLAAILLTGSAPAAVPDCPQFRGPQRDGKCAETGLLKQWPEGGPKMLWKIEDLGKGYSAVSIAGGKIFTMGDIEIEGAESQCVIAYDLSTQKRLWAASIGPKHASGPRGTPSVDGDHVYAIGTSGDIACAEVATGKVVWRKNFIKD